MGLTPHFNLLLHATSAAGRAMCERFNLEFLSPEETLRSLQAEEKARAVSGSFCGSMVGRPRWKLHSSWSYKRIFCRVVSRSVAIVCKVCHGFRRVYLTCPFLVGYFVRAVCWVSDTLELYIPGIFPMSLAFCSPSCTHARDANRPEMKNSIRCILRVRVGQRFPQRR